MKWSLVYFGIYDENGQSRFEAKLPIAILESLKRSQGSYKFANQYENVIIPKELQTFKKEWIRYYSSIPKRVNTFIFVDPAISQADSADFTGVVVVHVDADERWYIAFAKRFKITATAVVNLLFDLTKQFDPVCIGIEDVAYQKALLHFLDEEMRRRNILIPAKGIRPPTTKTKETRILGLVPRFEWQRISLAQGLQDLEIELMQFPRGSHDDLIDALANIELIAHAPEKEKEFEKEPGPQHPDYERWYRNKLFERAKETTNYGDGEAY